ncbi:hypothetical protein FB639_003475, partial [Coemansia asiatica]
MSSSIKLTHWDPSESSSDYTIAVASSNSLLSTSTTNDILSASDPISYSTSSHLSSLQTSIKAAPTQTSGYSSPTTPASSSSLSLSSISSSISTPSETRFRCLYPNGTSDLYVEQINGKSAVFKCLMGTKCYQTIDQYESIKCVYPKDLVASSSSASSTETDTSSSSSGISVLLGARSAFKSQDELGQTDLGFHNNRFAQVPLESILSSLSLSVTPAAEDRMQTTIPTSSEPRVISVNIVLPTFAIKITEDPNVLSVATVLSIDPNAETTTASTSASASETQALDLSEDNAGIAKDSFFLTVDNSDFSSLSTAQGNTTPETPTTSAAAAAAAAMGAAAITATATTTVTTTAEKAKLLVSTTKPIPIFGTPDVATRKALGRLALEMATPWVTAAATDDQEFTQSIVTRAANKNRAN